MNSKYFHFSLFLDYAKMKFIAGAISNLIDNFMPNDNRYYVSSNWVTDELIPTLKTMNQRAIQLKGAIENNKG